MKNWAKYGIVLYGVGILLALPSSYHFFLGTYGQGGVAEYRGRMPLFDKYFPEGTDYILFNHGQVTPISKRYYDLIQRAESIGTVSWLVGLPFLLFGLLAYGSRSLARKRDWRVNLWLWLFFPKKGDPFITFFAKLAFLLEFLSLLAAELLLGGIADEEAFVRALHILYGTVAALSLVLTIVLRALLLKHMGKRAPNNGMNLDGERSSTA